MSTRLRSLVEYGELYLYLGDSVGSVKSKSRTSFPFRRVRKRHSVAVTSSRESWATQVMGQLTDGSRVM